MRLHDANNEAERKFGGSSYEALYRRYLGETGTNWNPLCNDCHRDFGDHFMLKCPTEQETKWTI